MSYVAYTCTDFSFLHLVTVQLFFSLFSFVKVIPYLRQRIERTRCTTVTPSAVIDAVTEYSSPSIFRYFFSFSVLILLLSFWFRFPSTSLRSQDATVSIKVYVKLVAIVSARLFIVKRIVSLLFVHFLAPVKDHL